MTQSDIPPIIALFVWLAGAVSPTPHHPPTTAGAQAEGHTQLFPMSAEEITRLRNEGNVACSRQDWAAAESLYTESLAAWTQSGGRATPAAAEAAKTLANRSACRLRMERHEDAKADALACLDIQPCYARAMLLYGQAEWQVCQQGSRMLDAPVWPFLSACALDDRYTAETLRLNVMHRTAEARTAAAIALARGGPGKAWAAEGTGSGLRHSRRLVASRSIAVGEVVLPAALPFAFGPDQPLEACRRCTKAAPTGSHICNGCRAAAYCSKACKSSDASLHAAECDALSYLRVSQGELKAAADAFGVSHTDLHSRGLLPRPGADRIDVEDLTTSAGLAACTVLRAACLAGAESPGWRDVMQLESHALSMDLEGPCLRAAVNHASARLAGQALAAVPKAGQALLEGLARSCDFLPEASRTPSGLAELAAGIVQANSFEVDAGVALVPPPLAWVNHSCLPNAAKQDSGELRCCRSIAAGEEICTAYIADLMQPTARRQAALRSLHTFTCGCRRCAAEGVAEGPEKAGIPQQPLADIVKCGACKSSWVCVTPNREECACMGCGAVGTWAEVGPMLEQIEADVERVGPVLHGGIESVGDVDEELLAQMEAIRADAACVLHSHHWLMHRIHAYLIRPYLSLQRPAKAAEYSLLALAAMDTTLQAHWVGKAERAGYAATHHASLPASLPTSLKVLYTKPVLEEIAGSLAALGLV